MKTPHILQTQRTKTREVTIRPSYSGFSIFNWTGIAGTSKKDYDFSGISALRQLLSNEKARILDVIKTKKPVSIYALAKILGRDFGMTYPIEDGATMKQIELLRGKLFAVVKDSLDSLVHHGEKVLDSFGQIDPRLVNDEEAIRFKYDKDWDKKVAAFNQLVRVKPITKVEANKLKLINA